MLVNDIFVIYIWLKINLFKRPRIKSKELFFLFYRKYFTEIKINFNVCLF